MEIKTLILKRSAIEYATFGSGKKNFVMVSGMGLKSVMGSAPAVAASYSAFAKDYTVYLFDRINEMPDDYTVEEMADDTAEALHMLGLSDIYLFGMSQGGMIVQVIAEKYPELVKKLVLCSTYCKPDENALKTLSGWMRCAEEKNAVKAAGAMIDVIYTDGFLARYRDILLKMYADTTAEDLRRFGIMAKACYGFDFSDRIKNIKCPVFVVGAEGDKIMSSSLFCDLAEKLGCERYIYEGYSHAVCDEAPDFKERILDFYNNQNG